MESEVDRLSRSLNASRTAATEAESSARKAVEEHARETSNKVCHVGLEDSDLMSYQLGTRDRTAKTVSQELC